MGAATPEPAIWYGTADESVSYSKGMPALSVRNIYPIPPQGGTSGNDAEQFEVRDYNASIETQARDATCAAVADLKALDYVIFENANESDTACNYTFKVAHAHVEEILAIIKNLGPKNLSENSYTIKNQIEDYTSRTDILKKKLSSIDATLSGALGAYDELTVLATRTQNVETLARIIDSKLQVIERLTNERLNVSAELEQIARAKSQELDRLDYSRFYVSIYENKYLDAEALSDSWKVAFQEFVRNVNHALQNATVNLVAFVFLALPYALYLFLLLIAAKYGWRTAKYLWKK